MTLLIACYNQQSHVTGSSFGINMQCSSVLMSPNIPCDLSPLLSALVSSLCLMLALLANRSTTSLVWALAHSLGFTPANIGYAKRIVHMGQADNAVQETKALQDVTNQSISSQTVCRNLKKFGLRPVVKKKRPLLKPCH